MLKIEKWLALNLCNILELPPPKMNDSLYAIDMSSKNLRWKHKIWLSEQLKALNQR